MLLSIRLIPNLFFVLDESQLDQSTQQWSSTFDNSHQHHLQNSTERLQNSETDANTNTVYNVSSAKQTEYQQNTITNNNLLSTLGGAGGQKSASNSPNGSPSKKRAGDHELYEYIQDLDQQR